MHLRVEKTAKCTHKKDSLDVFCILQLIYKENRTDGSFQNRNWNRNWTVPAVFLKTEPKPVVPYAHCEIYNSKKVVRLWETKAWKWTWRSSLSSAHNAALFQSITSENGRTQSLLSRTGIQADCSDSRNLKFVIHQAQRISQWNLI